MVRKLKIAMVAAYPFPVAQGSQVFIKQMSKALVKRGHRVHLVCYHFGERHEAFNFTIHRIPRITSYSRFREGPSLRKSVLLGEKCSQSVIIGLFSNATNIILVGYFFNISIVHL